MKAVVQFFLLRFIRARNVLANFMRPHALPAAITVLDELALRYAREAADFVQQHMEGAISFVERNDLLSYALAAAPAEGLLAEFGVWKGGTVNHLARRAGGRKIFGFDSFRGLAEDWSGTFRAKGSFDLKGRLPRVRENVTLVPGWFDVTVPAFLNEHQGDFAFVHIDGDTYEAAKAVLDRIGDRIKPGTVIVFDEFFGYRGWKSGEFKAWSETAAARGLRFQYLAFSVQQVAIRLL